jgi:hypothetical protein
MSGPPTRRRQSTAPSAAEKQAWLALKVHLYALFNERRWLEPEDWQVHVGLSGYYTKPTVPADFKDQARARQLNLLANYFIGRLPTPVSVRRVPDGAVNIVLPSTLFDQPLTTTEAFLLKRRADLVWDDDAELAACQFPNTDVATELGTRVRQEVYGGSLLHIKLPPGEMGVSSVEGDATFAAAAAEKATYAEFSGDWLYYPKWRQPKPVERKHRRFEMDHLSDDYLRHNFQAFDLQKDSVYLLLRIPAAGVSALLRLYLDEPLLGQTLFHEVITVQGLSTVGDHFAMMSEILHPTERVREKPRAEAWFVYALEGTTAPPPFFAKTVAAAPDLSLNVMEQVVDPQYMVQSIRGLPWHQIEEDHRRWSARDWLRELIRLRFSEPWVWFMKDPGIEMAYEINREELFLRELRAEIARTTGPMKERLQTFLQTAQSDPGLHLVRRGRRFGPTQVVGSDDAYVYLYDKRRKLLTRLPMYAFWRDENVKAMAAEISRNTRGMIPIAKALTFGGVAVAGWAVVGTQTLLSLAREYVVDRITGEVVSEAVKRAIKTLQERILLSILAPVMALVPSESTSAGTPRNHLFRFFKGFIQGYANDALAAMFSRWESVARLEPAAYRAVKLLMKIEAVVRLVDEKISELGRLMDQRRAELLLNRFAVVLMSATTGFMGVVNALYFLEYHTVRELLAAYADLTGEKMPTKIEWDRLRHAHMLETFRQYAEGIEREQVDLKELYASTRQGLDVIQKIVWIAGATYVVNVASGGMLTALVGFALVKTAKFSAKVVAAGAASMVLITAVDGKMRELVWDTIRDIASAIKENAADVATRSAGFVFGRHLTPDRTERIGQLVGQLYGGITLNKGVFGKDKSWIERFERRKISRHVLKTQLAVSPVLPILKLLLFNYTYMIEKVIADSRQSWGEFEKQIADILVDPDEILRDDKPLTLANLLRIIALADDTLQAWLTRLSQDPELAFRIAQVAQELDRIRPDKLPTIAMLRDGSFPEGGWSREAMLFVLLSHLQASLRFIAQSIRAMHTPIESDDPRLNIALVLGLLGFEQDENEVLEILDRNFDDLAGTE